MIEGKRYQIDDYSLLVLRPAQIHRVHLSGDHPFEYFSLMCDAPALFPELTSQLSNCVGILTFKDYEPVYHIFQELSRQNEDVYKASHVESRSLLVEELLRAVSEAANQADSSIPLTDDPVVNKAVHYIEANIDSIVSLDAICEAIGVTRGTLYNRFIKSMLISPTKYIRAKRMALTQLVSRNELDRAEILKRYGFKNEESFDREYEYFYRSVP